MYLMARLTNAIFTEVYKTYMKLQPVGIINKLNNHLAGILGCGEDEVYTEIEKLLNHIIPKKALHEYGMTQEDIADFTETVMTKQTRLMNNNYTELTAETVTEIYKSLF